MIHSETPKENKYLLHDIQGNPLPKIVNTPETPKDAIVMRELQVTEASVDPTKDHGSIFYGMSPIEL